MHNLSYMKRFRKRLRSGERLVGTMCEELGGARITKALEAGGYDFFFIDCEHGVFGLETVFNMVMSADFSRIVPFVRVAEIRKEAILKVLDLGVAGIMVPAVRTPEEVRAAVELARYKPEGRRGFSTLKYYNNYSSERPSVLLAEANSSTSLVVQIETCEAVESIEEIASIDGIDALLVGPGDLSLSYGYPGRPDHPDVTAAARSVLETARAHGIGAGIHCGGLEDLQRWSEAGMNMLMWSSPMAMVLAASRSSLTAVRGPRPDGAGGEA